MSVDRRPGAAGAIGPNPSPAAARPAPGSTAECDRAPGCADLREPIEQRGEAGRIIAGLGVQLLGELVGLLFLRKLESINHKIPSDGL